jgi:hypothetical protein
MEPYFAPHRVPAPGRYRGRSAGRVRREPSGVALMPRTEPPAADGSPVPVAVSAEQIQTDLRAALTELEEAKTRTYHDAEEDRRDADRYYHGAAVDPTSRVADADTPGSAALPAAKELYPWIDLQPDGSFRSLYTGEGGARTWPLPPQRESISGLLCKGRHTTPGVRLLTYAFERFTDG